jgi:large subunit ribosomal protein L3
MTFLFNEDGRGTAGTVLEVGPCVVVQQRTTARDGYEALQLGFEEVGAFSLTQPLEGHFKSAVETWRRAKERGSHLADDEREALRKVGGWRVVREVRVNRAEDTPVGTELRADLFQVGTTVDVVGTSKGRGFAGGMRRHGFRGSGASHGAKIHRKPASAGATDAARVFPGKRGPGHLGAARTVVQNLKVLHVDPENNVLVVEGGVPGPRGGLVMVSAEE